MAKRCLVKILLIVANLLVLQSCTWREVQDELQEIGTILESEWEEIKECNWANPRKEDK